MKTKSNLAKRIRYSFAALAALFLPAFTVHAQQEQDREISVYNNDTEITARGSVTLKPGFYIPSGKTVRIYTTGLSFEKCVAAINTLNTVSANQNYILTKTFKKKGILTDGDTRQDLSTCEVSQTVQYIDGLGRLLQTITVQGSPGFRDMVQPVAYDAFGREAVKYQPYAAVSNGGAYRTDALTAGAGQAAFYASTAGIKTTATPFSVTVFEPSPLNRVEQQGAPGDAWQPAASRTATAGRTVVSEYGTNVAAEPVKLWTVTSSGASSTGAYTNGKLYKTKVKNENWVSGNAGTADEYKDFEDHVVLKRVWETDTKSLSTYYVYDDLGNLRYVLPPAVNENGSNINSFTESDAAFKNFIYGYHYDGRKRLIEKQVPGKGWRYMVYNTLDQVVLSQDSLLKGMGKWNYSKYDAFGRTVSTGLYTRTIARPVLQTEVSTDGLTNSLWESRPDAANSDYTNVAFPRAATEAQVINYYDNYSFAGNSFGAPTGDQMPAARTKTLLTGAKVNTLGTATMLLTVNYYDDEGRVIQSKSQNHVNGTDVVDNTYDFIGQLKASKRTHVGNGATTTIATRYDLDHMGRKLATWESINGAPEIALNRMYYNELGQVIKKSVHSNDTTNFLQSGTYAYNERGWTKTYTSPQFSYDLKYQDGTTAQFNGNIANQSWGANGSNPNTFTYGYDKLNRLLSGTSTGIAMSEILTYDVMGNIASLNRNGTFGTYTYQDGNQLKQVTGGLATGLYTYDANGNAKIDGRTGVTLTYNQLNLPATVTKTGLIMAYTYDATGVKLRKVSNGATRDYTDGIEYDGTNIDLIHTDEGLARRNGTTYSYEYNLTDHLGNVRLSFYKNPSAALEVLQQTNYYPFGKTSVAKDGPNKYLYNGKELQQELGQLDYGARFYDPEIGRWNVVDPLAEKVYSVNPFAYTNNNPVNNVDPNGMETYFGQEAQDMFRQLQSQMSSRPPDEFYVDASGKKTKVSDKGGSWYNYYNFAAGTTNPLSGKTLAVGAISGEILGMANKPSDINFYVPSGSALLASGRTDNDYFFDGMAVGGVALKPLFALAGRTIGALLGRTSLAAAETGGQSLVQLNRAAGNAFRDELAAGLQAEGREVSIEVFKRTPFGARYIDIEVSQGGRVLGGIETKVGASRYTPLQRIKDIWLDFNTPGGYPVQLVRKP